MPRNVRTAIAVVMIAGVMLGGAAVAAQDTGSSLPTPVLVTPTPLPALNVATGEQLPAFTAVAADYSLLSQEDLTGQAVALIFFASWCPHCQAEAPRIVAAAAAHPSVRVVMLSVADRETPRMAFDFGARFGLPFPTYWDGGTAARGRCARVSNDHCGGSVGHGAGGDGRGNPARAGRCALRTGGVSRGVGNAQPRWRSTRAPSGPVIGSGRAACTMRRR